METYLLESRKAMLKRYFTERINSSGTFSELQEIANGFFPGEISDSFYLQDISGRQHGCNGGCDCCSN